MNKEYDDGDQSRVYTGDPEVDKIIDAVPGVEELTEDNPNSIPDECRPREVRSMDWEQEDFF